MIMKPDFLIFTQKLSVKTESFSVASVKSQVFLFAVNNLELKINV